MNSIRKTLLLAVLAVAAYSQSFAQNMAQIVWVQAEAVPVDGGLVYVNWYLEGDEMPIDITSEFKRAESITTSWAYILAEPMEGWRIAGYARDNGNHTYDSGVDEQIYVKPNLFFTAKIYPETYYGEGSSTTSALIEAELALEDKAEPSDLVYAVFTQGDIAVQAEDQEWMGKVWCSKLDNEVGDEVLFAANGESISMDGVGTKYYKFDHWSTPDGEDLYDRVIKVSVQGGETYVAHFAQTTKDDYMANERQKPDFTAINSISKDIEVSEAKTFDLQGRRIESPRKGVYIRDGRKVVLK